MKTKLLLLSLFVVGVINAQSLEDRNIIINGYNKTKVNALIGDLQAKETEKDNRINTYLLQYPNIEASYYQNNVHYKLYDIIDNQPVYITSDNRNCAIATQTNSLYPGESLGLNLEGEGMVIGVWEIDYPLKNHQEFLDDSGNTRISTPDTTNPNPADDFHATHVTGTVGAKGVNGGAKGMAPKSTLLAYNSTNDNSETATAHFNTGMLVSNHSYGIYISNEDGSQNAPTWMMGCYNSEARSWDQVAYNNPYYLKVTSAGNSGTDSYSGGFASGFDKLTSDKNAKNSLIIASAAVSIHPLFESITGLNKSMFSSQGPTDDGRIKPDITGRGESVSSASNTSTTSYAASQGTSMSSPNVAGSLLLLQEHYHDLNSVYMKSSTLRGLACHTATDDADYSSVITGSVFPGPDPYWGWGLLNTKFAAETITKAQNNTAILEEKTLTQGETYTTTVNVSNTDKLMATICWTDPAGAAQDGVLNSTVTALVNDLDIRITDSSNNEYLPWKLDITQLPNALKGDNTVDNIERVEIDLPSAGQYTITVSHKVILSGGSQDYALIITGSDLTLSTQESNLSDLMIWPNPVNDNLNFKFNSRGSSNILVSLVDIQGREVYFSSLNGNTAFVESSINVDDFAKGVYILKIKQANAELNKRVIIH